MFSNFLVILTDKTSSLEGAIIELEQKYRLNLPGLGWFKAEYPSYYPAYEKLVGAILPTLDHYSNVELFQTQFKKSIGTLTVVSPEHFVEYVNFIIGLNERVLEEDRREGTGSRGHSPLLESLQAIVNIIKSI